MVRAALPAGSDGAAGGRLARDRARRRHADRRADRLGQDARGVPRRASIACSARPPQRGGRLGPTTAPRSSTSRRSRRSPPTSSRTSQAPLAEIARRGARARPRRARDPRRGAHAATRPRARAPRCCKRPPHLLVTTPESLYLLLTAERSRERLRRVRTVIVDEIHALARDKRGAHLALTLERLDALCDARGRSASACRPRSARSRPIARLLVGVGEGRVDAAGAPACDDRRRRPPPRARPRDRAARRRARGRRLARAVGRDPRPHRRRTSREHRTTLVFVNTRRLAERLAHLLAERLGEDKVAAHHGSLSKERRLRVEARLRAGDLRALVATASLELGIDIGPVELVCQIGSPRSLATFLQRVGRSGHARGATPKGRLFPTTRDELVECAALAARRARGPARPRAAAASRRSTSSRSRSSRPAASEPWTRGRALRAGAPRRALRGARPRATSTPWSSCSPRASRPAAAPRGAYAAPRPRQRRAARAGAARASPRSPRAARSPRPPTTASSPIPTTPSSARSTRTGRSRAWPATCSCSAARRGASAASRPGVVRVVDAQGAPPTVPFWLGEAPARTRRALGRGLGAARARGRAPRAGDDAPAPQAWLAAECGVDARRRGADRRLPRRGAARARRRCRRSATSCSSASSTRPAACSS